MKFPFNPLLRTISYTEHLENVDFLAIGLDTNAGCQVLIRVNIMGNMGVLRSKYGILWANLSKICHFLWEILRHYTTFSPP